VHLGRRENVCFGKRDVSAVVLDALVTPKRILFGKNPGIRAARDVRDRLVVAESREGGVRGGEVMVYPDVELGFIQLAYRRIDEVDAAGRIVRVRMWIQIDQRLADGAIEQVRGDLVASG